MGHGYPMANWRAESKDCCRKDGWLPALSAVFKKRLFNYFPPLMSDPHQPPAAKLWVLIRHAGWLLPGRPFWEFKLQDLLQPESSVLHSHILIWAIIMIRIWGLKRANGQKPYMVIWVLVTFFFFSRSSNSLKCFTFFLMHIESHLFTSFTQRPFTECLLCFKHYAYLAVSR